MACAASSERGGTGRQLAGCATGESDIRKPAAADLLLPRSAALHAFLWFSSLATRQHEQQQRS
jgi:hypothetical protein